MPSIAADDHRTEYAIYLKQRELVSPTTVLFLVFAGQVHFCILVHNLPGVVDHMGKVEKAVFAPLNGPRDHPNPVLLRRLTRLAQNCADFALVQFQDIREIVAGQIRFWKQDDSTAFLSRRPDVMERPLQIEFQRPCPMHLHARNLQYVCHIISRVQRSRSGAPTSTLSFSSLKSFNSRMDLKQFSLTWYRPTIPSTE